VSLTDWDTGLIYLQARVYDPSISQFLTRDPLDAEAGQSYEYAGDNPINFADPSGLDDAQMGEKGAQGYADYCASNPSSDICGGVSLSQFTNVMAGCAAAGLGEVCGAVGTVSGGLEAFRDIYNAVTGKSCQSDGSLALESGGVLVGGVGGKLVSVGKDIFSEGSEKIAEGGLLHSGLGHFGQGVGALTRGTGGTVNAAGFATTNALANSGCGCG
jgi:RHS repeat-associated protein